MKQINSIQNDSVAENTIQRVFACVEFRSNSSMKNSFMSIERKVEGTSVLWISKVLLFFSLNGQVDRSERQYAFLHYMDRTRRLGGIDMM